jgi:hypothetical protein
MSPSSIELGSVRHKLSNSQKTSDPGRNRRTAKLCRKSLSTQQEFTMPTALPTSYSVVIAGAPQRTGSLRPVWLLVTWALVMLLMGAFANPDAETGPKDPLQLLMVF